MGEDCLNKINGMFAFVIYDKINKSFFMARDRFGIKPFYYYTNGESFVFASDIPSILTTLKKYKLIQITNQFMITSYSIEPTILKIHF